MYLSKGKDADEATLELTRPLNTHTLIYALYVHEMGG